MVVGSPTVEPSIEVKVPETVPAPVPAPVAAPAPSPVPAPVPVAAPVPAPVPAEAPVAATPVVADEVLAADTQPPDADIPTEGGPTVIVTEHVSESAHGVDAVIAVLFLVLWRTLTRRIGKHEGKVESLSTSLEKAKLDGEAVSKALNDANAALEEVRVLREAVAVLSKAAPKPAPKPKASKTTKDPKTVV